MKRAMGADAAVVLEVGVGAIADPSLLVIDEDALFSDFGPPSSGPHDDDFPDYYVSVRATGRLGYRGVLGARHLSVMPDER